MAVYDLGLSSEQFWRLTFAQLEALMDRRAADLDRCDLRAGIVASTIANVNRDTKRRPTPFTPKDFMPISSNDKSQNTDKATPAEIAAKWDMIKTIHNARIKTQ